MRVLIVITHYLIAVSAAMAGQDDKLETWTSPNDRYAIKEMFYGVGRLLRGVFVNLPTGRTATIYPGGARSLSALWSPNSHFVVLTADRTKNCCEAKLFRVEHGKIAEIALPENMDPWNYLSPEAKAHPGYLAFRGMHAKRWISDRQLEIVSETLKTFRGTPRIELVSQCIVVEIYRGEARIAKTYAAN